MVSVLLRSSIPSLLCFSQLSRRQLPSIRCQLPIIFVRQFTSVEAIAQEPSQISATTATTSSAKGDYEHGTNDTRATRRRRERTGRRRRTGRKVNNHRVGALRLVATRASSNLLPWQKRITSFEQLNYESSLNLDSWLGLRLVDDVKYRYDPDLLLALIRFRERIDGVKGIAVIWKAFAKRVSRLKGHAVVEEVVPQENVDQSWREIWKSFLRAGFEDHQILKEICEYKRLNKKRWKVGGIRNLYLAVIGHVLKVAPLEAFEWHERLKAFPPNTPEQVELFDQAISNLLARRALLAIYADLPYPRLYSSIIPKLCALELYSEAISWHRMLLSRGDRPSSISIVKPLLEHLASYRQVKLLDQVTLELVNAGIPLDTTADVVQEDAPVVSRQSMNEIHAKFYNITPKQFSDGFCARLLATRMFSVKGIISGLQMLGVQVVGPLALREIALRTVDNGTCRLNAMTEHLDQIYEAKIEIASSKFSRLVQRLVREKHDQLLYSLATCDQHPDVLENQELQESLLPFYHRTGDDRQFERTIAVLTVDEKDEAMDTAYWNILVRCDLKLQDLSGLLKKTEIMRDKGITLTHMSRSHMWCRLMNAGIPGQLTRDTKTQTLISIWQAFMISGTYFELTDWIATLHRLGFHGQLKQYERLAFWLAKWYTDSNFRKSLTGVLKKGDESQVSSRYRVQLSQADSVHPLQILFPEDTQVAILHWGFKKMNLTNLNDCMPSERVGRLAASDGLWGLRMIATVRDLGFKINRGTISSLCQTHLKILETKFLKNTTSGDQGYWHEYALAMEMIWGQDLFTESSKKQGTPQKPSSAHERLLMISDSMSHSTDKKP
ncbi:hypothetical protein MMC34_001299 [Xylographa carneopallida]|nr:hypothetical protein [Xylographa carneopallida]